MEITQVSLPRAENREKAREWIWRGKRKTPSSPSRTQEMEIASLCGRGARLRRSVC